MKATARVLGGLLAAGILTALVVYGTLSPCEVLKRDIRAFIHEMARDVGSVPGVIVALAAGPAAENAVAEFGPVECVRVLVRLRMDREATMADLSKAAKAKWGSFGAPMPTRGDSR